MRILTSIAIVLILLSAASPSRAQQTREFTPIPRGEMYEQEFIADFFDALGYRAQGLSWVDESETLRLLITAASQAERGRTDEAIATFGILPDVIASQFPFLTSMKEDLLVPEMLSPWYQNEQAREKLFTFYEEVWLPHSEYRDDYQIFREDTMGRASRNDPDVPAVWILGHLSDYGFVPDRALSQDDPYLFLWNLLTELTYYAQRANYYEVQWNAYREIDWRFAVVKHVGEMIHAAHDEAVRRETGRGFWSDLLQSRNPFEAPASGTTSTGQVNQTHPTQPTSQTGSSGSTGTIITPEEQADAEQAQAEAEEAEESYDLFRTPDENEETGASGARDIETLITELDTRLGVDVSESGTATEIPEETETLIETPVETETPTGTEIPYEFQAGSTPGLTPFELAPEDEPPLELGNYATVRLGEIAVELSEKIGELARALGRETIDIVVLYNDVNVSEETITNAEDRYIAKREEFLAGLAVWDRFNMEIYSPLTLADFNALVLSNIRAPYEELKSNRNGWAQYSANEENFEKAFGQIESGVRNRRDNPDVLAAEAAALTAFLGDYNDMMKEIEDLLSGAITQAP